MSDGPSEPDFKSLLRGLAQPALDALDDRVKKEIDRRVDEAVLARVAVLESAVAELRRRLDALSEG
jgi:uncharacterized protein YceH (UPF0502 family)